MKLLEVESEQSLLIFKGRYHLAVVAPLTIERADFNA
jgi:hypothetical protein